MNIDLDTDTTTFMLVTKEGSGAGYTAGGAPRANEGASPDAADDAGPFRASDRQQEPRRRGRFRSP